MLDVGAPARMMCSTLPPHRLDRLACGFVEGQERENGQRLGARTRKKINNQRRDARTRKGKKQPAAGRKDQRRNSQRVDKHRDKGKTAIVRTRCLEAAAL